MNPATLTDAELSAAIESACKIAAAQYAAHADTTEADAHVDMLMAEYDRRAARS